MGIWQEISEALEASAEDKNEARLLLSESRQGMPLNRTQSSMLKLPDALIASYFAQLEEEAKPEKRLAKEPESSWMLEAGFCWLNIRASAHDNRAGSFLQAAKLLPAISSNAILLAPFHPVEFELCYAPLDMHSADPSFSEAALASHGISLAEQLRAFVSACRLLGKAVGYELLFYASQFSRIAMERPRLFRWVLLDKDRKLLAMADPDHPYSRKNRLRDAEAVAVLVSAVKDDYGIGSFLSNESDSPEQSAKRDKAYYSAIKLCIDEGLWPVPAHARNGVGIPSFLRYDGPGDFPVFSYLDKLGNDLGGEAYSVVTPFAFYDEMPVNMQPSASLPLNQEAVEYYCEVFPYWRDNFGFEFMRMNAVDSLFSELLDENGLIPSSDRPTAKLLSKAIKIAKQSNPGVGIIASRKGAEHRDYGKLGFDLVMGNESLRRIDAVLVRDCFAIYDELNTKSGNPASSGKKSSACFAVDVPESSSPRLWGSPMIKVMGTKRMHLRHAFAHFISVGRAKRPLFETMGFQDGSSGLYEAGLSVRGLDWADDAMFAQGYTLIEKLHDRFRNLFASGRITERHVEAEYAWWMVKSEDEPGIVVIAASLETAEGRAPGNISIQLDPGSYEGTVHRIPSLSSLVCIKDQLSVHLDFLDILLIELKPVVS
ncbi:hypothetical protein MASR2M29_01650 [Spirochaetota bacterium]